MVNEPAQLLAKHLRTLSAAARAESVPDGEFLQRFAAQRDEEAFATLVRRHGPMVLRVCQRVLHDVHAAEDAFQAAFLVLSRKAASLRRADSVGCWLHSVAYRLALKARTQLAQQRKLDVRGTVEKPTDDPLAQLTVREAQAMVDEELTHLPEKYRAPLVLCYLEGKTRDEAARQLGWSAKLVKSRLEQGRARLRSRLSRRGLTLPAALVATLLAEEAAPAALPATLLRAAVQTAIASPAHGVSAPVAVLADGALGGTTTVKVKVIVGLLLLMGVLAAGAGAFAPPQPATKQAETPSAAKTPETAKSEEQRSLRTDRYGDPLPPGAVARMGSVQLRHEGAHLAFSADGKTLISAGWDRTVRFWDMTTGRQRHHTRIELPKTPEDRQGVEIAGLSPDGKSVAVFVGDELRLYDTATGEEQRRLPGKGVGHGYLTFSADGKWLATLIGIADNYTLRLWDLSTGKECLVLEKLSQAGRILLSSDGSRLAYVAAGELHVRDTATGRELGKGSVEGWYFAISPDGQMLATATYKGTVTLWDAAGLKKLATLQPSPGVTGRIVETPCLTFSPDGKLLAIGGLEALVLWDVAARKERLRLEDRKAKELLFSADGKTLACAGSFEIRLWNIGTGERLHGRAGHDICVDSVAVSPDGRIVASADVSDPVVRLWEAATGKPLPLSPRHDSGVRSCAFAPDGRLLVSGGFGVVRLLDASTGAEQRRFVVMDRKTGKQNHEILVSHLSADGKLLAVVGKELGQRQTQLTLWDARTGELLAQRPFNGWLGSCFTPDGEGVTVDGRQQLTIEDTRMGQHVAAIPGDLGYPTTFSWDGQFIAVGMRKTQDNPPGGWLPLGIRVVEMASREELFHVDGWIDYTAFSPDGRRLVTADAKSLRLWDVETGEQLLRRPWPANAVRHPSLTPIHSLAFLPNGCAVVTGMNDGTLLVWDMTPPMRKLESGKRLSDKELEMLWADLAGDCRQAYRAMHRLAGSGAAALSLLAKHLHPVAAVDPKRVDKLLTDLDSEQLAARDAAVRELEGMGEQIEPALRRVLESKPSLEVRNRIQTIQDALRGVPPHHTLRTLRAIHVLERIGTPEAQDILRTLAGGAAAARETREAKAALQRLIRGSATQP